ncbi:hypothetical protein ACT4US_35325, partial [Bacillus sp. HC-Mk]
DGLGERVITQLFDADYIRTFADLYAAKSAAQQEGIDPNNIFILGHSLGAGTMPRILSKAPSSLVRGSILLAPPARPLTDIAIDQYQYLGESKEVIDELKRQVAFIQDPAFNPDHPPAGYNLGSLAFYLVRRKI